jgi:hypothetical protein
LRLAEPKRPATTARAVISAVAQEAGHDDGWADERLAWLQDRWGRDGELAATPLMVVLLATLAATVDEVHELPGTRTAVLIEALREVVTRWEVGTRHDGHVEVGGLPKSQANEALQRALYVFAAAALEGAEDTQKALTADLESFLGPMTKGRLRACVRDATEFWAATGLFTFTEGAVRAQPRSLAEAALAWQAIEEEVEPTALMRHRATSAGWEVLSLIAIERVDVRRTWVSAAAADGSVDELIAVIDAHLDGAALAEGEMAQLVDSSAVVAMGDDHDLERVVEALLALELPLELQARLRHTIEDRTRLADHPVTDAALLVRSPNLASHEIDRLRAFFSAPRPESRRDDEGTLHINALDRLHLRTLQDVALWLLSHSREDAEFVASRLEKLKTRTFPARLRRAFQRAGHADLAREARATAEVEPIDWRHRFGDFEEATRTALRVASASAEPRPLSFIERRRLDELADLWTTLRSESWSPKWVVNRTGLFEDFVRLALALGGFDSAAIAAQARQVLRELEDDPDVDDVVRDDAIQRRLSRWDRIEDCEHTVDSLVRIFGHVPYQCLTPLMQALDSAPCKTYVQEALLAEIPDLTRIWRMQATLLALVTASDPIGVAAAWSTADDVRRRHAAATAVRYLRNAAPDVGERVALALLEDQDRGVRAQVVAELAAVTDDGRALSQAIEGKLQSLQDAPRTPYLCQWCDAAVPAHMASCPNCETSAPSFAEELDRALGRQRSVAPDLSRRLQELAPRRRVRGNHSPEWNV